MAVVKDTQSFISAARCIHGRRYDYSLAEWNGANSKITLICRVCGPFEITANSHYRKGCGCRECGLKSKARRKGQYQVCPYCRKWAKYRGAGLACRECSKSGKARQKRRENYIQAMQRKCIKCGQQFTAKRQEQQICSIDCTLPLVKVQCCVCGKHAMKRHNEVRERNCCSLKCQRKLAFVLNHSTNKWRLPILSLNCGDQGKLCIQCSKWVSAFKNLAGRDWNRKTRTWRQKFMTIAYCNMYRRCSDKNPFSQSVNSWALWETAFYQLAQEKELPCKWKVRLSNMASQQNKRMQRKSLAASLRSSKRSSRENAITADLS